MSENSKRSDGVGGDSGGADREILLKHGCSANISANAPPRKHRWKNGDRCTVCGLNREGAGAGPYGSMRYYRDNETGRAYTAGPCVAPQIEAHR